MRLPRFTAVLVLAVAVAAQAHAADCDALLRQHLASDLALPFDAFDQDDHQGWRPVSDAGCDAEAAMLIESYTARQAHPHPVLAWHRAQMLARAGKTVDAIDAARATLRSGDDGSGFDWNDYANATIAFLQGDKPALQATHDRLAAAATKNESNQPNLRSTDRLLRCFGQPYKIAYACPARP
ncbi:MAG: hypothetical protein JF586_12380 [Burkholderiales bacterium]|nr:hypothetical protein [Burkholderiales bacterium]